MEAIEFIQKYLNKYVNHIYAYRYYKKEHYVCCDVLLIQVFEYPHSEQEFRLKTTIKVLLDNSGNTIYVYDNYKKENLPFPHLKKNNEEIDISEYCCNRGFAIEIFDFKTVSLSTVN